MQEWRVLALLGYLFPAESGKLLEELEGLEGLRLRKRQPIKEAIAAAVGCSCAIAVALWWRLPAVWAWQGFKKDRIHTSGGPRRRPGLGEGQGRRIYIHIERET